MGVLRLRIALLAFTGLQSRDGIRCAVKPVPVVPRLALAGEGPRGIVAGSCLVTSVFRTFINIRTLIPGTNKPWQASTAK